MTWPLVMAYTDEWAAYDRLPEVGRGHATVCHAAGEWARDDDGDGIREVHDNTLEGIWTGLRNYLRMFRGVNKAYLVQYVAVFLWSYNIKTVTDEFLRALLGVRCVPGERLRRRDVATNSPAGSVGCPGRHRLPHMSRLFYGLFLPRSELMFPRSVLPHC